MGKYRPLLDVINTPQVLVRIIWGPNAVNKTLPPASLIAKSNWKNWGIRKLNGEALAVAFVLVSPGILQPWIQLTLNPTDMVADFRGQEL